MSTSSADRARRPDARVGAARVVAGSLGSGLASATPSRRLSRPLALVARRRDGRDHGRRGRAAAGIGVRDHDRTWCAGRADHRDRRRVRRRRFRRVERAGLGADRGDDGGAGAGRGPLRGRRRVRRGDPRRRVGGARRHRASRPPPRVRSVAGDRGVHHRHRLHHLPPAGARRARGGPAGRGEHRRRRRAGRA